ncbi:MAG: hypothetical protein U0R24_02195 [Solirubrobacterales bacterium]
MGVDELALTVVVQGVGIADQRRTGPVAQVALVWGLDARIRQWVVLEEGLRRRLRVLGVDAEERRLVEMLGRLRLEVGELVAAGDAPGGPVVDDDRVALDAVDRRVVGVLAAIEDRVSVRVEVGERRWRLATAAS